MRHEPERQRFTTLLPVAKGSLVLLGGAQKSGKSTVTGNLAEPLVTRELNVLVTSKSASPSSK